MLKITVLEKPDLVAIKLDGRLGGPWTTELYRTWRSLASSLGYRKLCLDLCDMTYADTDGQQLLRQIYETSNAAFATSTPLSKYFAAEAMKVGEKKEN
jgi:hypothetical protein